LIINEKVRRAHIVLDDVRFSAMSWDPVSTANIDRTSRPDGGRCSRELEVEIARRRHLDRQPIRGDARFR
jgi:hypothetical protein